MFNDERITIESGKIFKGANLLAIIIAVLVLIGRIIVYITQDYSCSFGTFSTEFCTIMAALIILLYGELAFRSDVKDERSICEKYQFYSKHGKTLLIWILVGYSISMIDSFKRMPQDVAPNYIIFVFQALGAVYFYYMFKKKQININYSFIENDSKTYYHRVWKLIGYLSLIIVCVYMSCGIISMIIYHNIEYILIFLVAAFHSIIGLGLQYLLLSYLEKKDYDNEKEGIKIAFLITGIIVAVTLFVNAVCTSAIIYISNNGLVNEQGRFLANAIIIKNNIGFITTTYLGISLSYLLSFLNNKYINKTIFSYFILTYVETILAIVSSIILHFIINENMTMIYYNVMQYINSFLYLSFIVLFGILVLFIIRIKKFNKLLLLVPIFELACYLVGLFLFTQGNNGQFLGNTVVSFGKFISYTLFFIFIYKQGKEFIKTT